MRIGARRLTPHGKALRKEIAHSTQKNTEYWGPDPDQVELTKRQQFEGVASGESCRRQRCQRDDRRMGRRSWVNKRKYFVLQMESEKLKKTRLPENLNALYQHLVYIKSKLLFYYLNFF